MILEKEGPASMACCAEPDEEATVPVDTNDTSTAVSVNESQEHLRHRTPSPLELAKAIIPDVLTLSSALGWPIDSSGMNFAWYRGNSDTPSLNISPDASVWYDFALGKGGGPIDLLGLVEELDRTAACRRFIEVSADVQKGMSGDEIVDIYERAQRGVRVVGDRAGLKGVEQKRELAQAKLRDAWPEVMPVSDSDISDIIESRDWPDAAAAGLHYSASRDLLFTTRAYGNRVYMVSDSSWRSAKVRRLDGKPMIGGRDTETKVLCLKGSQSRWPLGAAEIREGDHVILVEGETDQLAMIALLAIFAADTLISTTVISLSASTGIHDQAMHLIKTRARRVTVVADADEAGMNAVKQWMKQFSACGVQAQAASIEGVVAGAKDISDLLTELRFSPGLSHRLHDWVTSFNQLEATKKL